MFTLPLIQKINLSSLLVLTAILFSFSHSATAGYYDDWWICANKCAEEDAACVDSCTDDFNSTHSSKLRTKTFGYRLQNKKAVPLMLKYAKTPQLPKRTSINKFWGGRCPIGKVATQFDMPIYDDEGLFVIGFETVWFCLDEGLEPAG